MPDKKYTTKDLMDRLHNKFQTENGYIVAEEVANGTGWNCSRHIDAVVFAVWPSLGLKRMAIEIKSDRSDFLAELKQPQKSQWAKDCCHEFLFLAPKGVIKDVNELPENCGWFAPHGQGLKIVRAASYKENPEMDDSLLCAFVRAAAKFSDSKNNRVKQDILKNSCEYQDSLAWQKAGERFIKERGGRSYIHEEEGILEELRQCTLNKELQKDKEQIEHALQQFEKYMFQSFLSFASFASHSILAKNGLGEYVMKLYGNDYESSLAKLKIKLKRTRKSEAYKRNEISQRIQLLELLGEFAPVIK